MTVAKEEKGMRKRPPYELILDAFALQANRYLEALEEYAKNARVELTLPATRFVHAYTAATMVRRMRLRHWERANACSQLKRMRAQFVPKHKKLSKEYCFSGRWFDRLIESIRNSD
jgi:hypothetical protein